MIVELLERVGTPSLRLNAAQVVVLNDQGTPIMVAGSYGPVGAVCISKAGDDDFNRTLRTFGYRGRQTNVDKVSLPKGPAIIS